MAGIGKHKQMVRTEGKMTEIKCHENRKWINGIMKVIGGIWRRRMMGII